MPETSRCSSRFFALSHTPAAAMEGYLRPGHQPLSDLLFFFFLHVRGAMSGQGEGGKAGGVGRTGQMMDD